MDVPRDKTVKKLLLVYIHPIYLISVMWVRQFSRGEAAENHAEAGPRHGYVIN